MCPGNLSLIQKPSINPAIGRTISEMPALSEPNKKVDKGAFAVGDTFRMPILE
jgi:hypothetical protein